MNLADQQPALNATCYVRDYVRSRRFPSDAVVGMAIAARTGDDGWAEIGFRALERQTGYCCQTIGDAIKRLEDAGHLEVKRGGRGNLYRVSTGASRPRESVARSRDSVARSVERAAHPSSRESVARTARVSRATARVSRATARVSRATARVSRAVPAPAAALSVRTEEKSSSSAALQPHAIEALASLNQFIEAEVERKRPRNIGAYRATVRRRIEADLLKYQDTIEAADLLARMASMGTLLPTSEERRVAELLGRAMAMPPSDERPPEPHVIRDRAHIDELLARGRAEARDGVA